ncbi:MAG: hypothetical protein HS104_12585 [Polyangiaceae bacterium]|nr:hypothetical protein [Polyangiaceae bacterium]
MADAGERATALHEAAHAVADERLDFGCAEVSIEPRPGTLGRASHVYEDGTDDDLILALLVGYAAAVRGGEDPADAKEGANEDLERASEILARSGRTDLGTHLARAEAFVRDNWPAIERVAAELLEWCTIGGQELQVVLDVADGNATDEDLARYRLMSRRVGRLPEGRPNGGEHA